MSQAAIIELLEKHKGQRYTHREIAFLMGRPVGSLYKCLAVLRRWNLIQYDTIKTKTRPTYVYWK